jgi:hypothetical protein
MRLYRLNTYRVWKPLGLLVVAGLPRLSIRQTVYYPDSRRLPRLDPMFVPLRTATGMESICSVKGNGFENTGQRQH